MSFLKTLPLLVVITAYASGQRLSHHLNAAPGDLSPRLAAAPGDTIDLLAVRAQFQIDSDVGTTGNGTFDLGTNQAQGIDAPPHDARYFRDHLLFLENYFRRVSRGRVIIRATLLDSVVTLPAPMSRYSPGKDAPPTPVADLARDAWRAVDSLHLVPSIAPYECFLVFHAGVGRDVDLAGTLGYDPAPRDIPSLTFGLQAFRNAYGQSFIGFPAQGGRITNTLVLPSTERRLLPGVGGDVPFNLGINGLLCASFGSYLGLPDLFNTATGRSGIGRFGLMDGQAIFSFYGAFPPEPSAWEKIWLGWVEPITVNGPASLESPAVGFGAIDPGRRDTIYRVPLSPTEYYLIENRNRDPERNGQKVSLAYRGESTVYSARRDVRDAFIDYDISALRGVVTDVEDFDWSLPGWTDPKDSTFYDGGILVWHIDETVIRESIGANAINANPSRPGIKLEEADGSQDIGQQYEQFTAGSGSEEGTLLDYWYAGNGSPVNRNEFTSFTHPDTRTNTGARSRIALRGFSVRGPRMSFRVAREEGGVRPLPGFPKKTGSQLPAAPIAIASPRGGDPPVVVVATNGIAARPVQMDGVPLPPDQTPRLFAWRMDGSAALPGGRADGLLDSAATASSGSGVAIADVTGDGEKEAIVTRSSSTGGGSFLAVSLTSVSEWTGTRLRNFPIPSPSTYPLATESLYAGGISRLQRGTLDGGLRDSLTFAGDSIAGVSRGLANDELIVTTARGSVLIVAGGIGAPRVVRQKSFGSGIAGPAISGAFGRGGPLPGGIAFTTRDGSLFMTDGDLNTLPGYPIALGGPAVASPALADLDGDGSRDLLAIAGTLLHAVNPAGARLDGFPVALGGRSPTSPAVGDIDGDGRPDVVAVLENGGVFAIDPQGRMLDGFPVAAGFGSGWPVIAVSGDSILLFVASAGDGTLSGWRTGGVRGSVNAAQYPWTQYQGDAARSGRDLTIPSQQSLRSDFFPVARAYNWPNPVYDGTTYLRYYLKGDANVRISVYDLAGDLVTEFAGPGIGGLDNEIRWDVSGLTSGIYFAHIQADGAGGSGRTVVKVAVVK